MDTPTTRSALPLLDLLSQIPDPRRRRTRNLYPLVNLLFIGLAGTLAGMRGWRGLAMFAELHKEWLARHLDLSAGLPSAQTYKRVLGVLKPDALEAVLRQWVASLTRHVPHLLHVDGKAVRGARDPSAPTTPLYFLHVWAYTEGMLLNASVCRGAPGEGDALREVLPLLELTGATLTGDANLCAKANTEAIRAHKAHYVLALKGNRGALHAEVERALARPGALAKRGVVVDCHRSVTRGHGREERRTVWAVGVKGLGLPTEGWRDLQTVVRVRRERRVEGSGSVEDRYYVSSRPPKARLLNRIVRRHWSVENDLHWQLDLAFDEDACAIRERNAARNVALLRRIALMLLKKEQTIQTGVALKMQRAAMDPNYIERLISLGTEAS